MILFTTCIALVTLSSAQEHWLEDGCKTDSNGHDLSFGTTSSDGCKAVEKRDGTARFAKADQAVGEIQCCSDHGKCTRMNKAGKCISGNDDAKMYNYFEAKAACAKLGLRLCTKAETLSRGAEGCCNSGCMHDCAVVWTSEKPGAPIRTTRMPGAVPSGVQRNMPSSKLTGWVKYFDQPYSHPSKEADLTRGLPGYATHIMVCGTKSGSATLMLCAAASKANVLRKTKSTSSASGPYNGVYWYNYPGKSFGFSDSRSIGLNSADTNSGSGRLSWHINNGNAGGYRIGNTKALNGSAKYRKQLYYFFGPTAAPTTSTPTPRPAKKVSLVPIGVQRNMHSSKLTGWVKYFDQPYKHPSKEVDLTRGLPGSATYIMVCGTKSGSATLMLCAAAKKADVLRKTSSTTRAYGPYNGVYWYNYPKHSFGFSDSRSISLNSADTISGSGRLSWHIDNGNNGGYRIGNTKGLNGSANYRKQLYYLLAATGKTCDGTNAGSRADHTSVRQGASTGYEAPGQRAGSTLVFPCRQGYHSGTVTYTCGADGIFRTRDRCTKRPTTPPPKGVWAATAPTGCVTTCGTRAGSGTPGRVVCAGSKYCDRRTKPQPNRCKATPACTSSCDMQDLLRLAGTHQQCTLALMGIETACNCLCTFAESDIRKYTQCAFGGSQLNFHEQWKFCKEHNPKCGNGGVVVVHGRRLRTA